MPILEFQHVNKVYNNSTKALDDVSFSVEKGEFVSIIGPSGAGKSTILRCINRLIDATDGNIIYDGDDILSLGKRDLRRVRTKTGMIFQHYNLVDRLSVIENVLHGRLGQKSAISGMLGSYSETEKEKAFSILNELGLAEQAYKRCDALSGGQKQRLTIARALVSKPDILILDDSLSALDFATDAALRKAIGELEGNVTTFLVSQRISGIRQADKILVMDDGELAGQGTHEELMETCETYQEIYYSQFPEERPVVMKTSEKTEKGAAE